MIRNPDRSRTNRDVFWSVFAERTGLEAATAERFFNRFYDERFPALQSVTELRPVAAQIVSEALEEGYQVAVATNPLFPARAIEHRLAWAGLPVDRYDFAVITSYENMHATKPHLAYYEEILARMGAAAGQTLMVGDDWENDIVPASTLGVHTYWITPDDSSPPDPGLIAASGSLDDFYHWFFAGKA
jgi:HAD superfamily hydrolase (TIGR01549 family)